MPTVQYSQKDFEQYVGKKLPEDKLKDRISFLGTDLEGIENGIIDVEIFPNRPDLLSIQGFARAFASFIGHKKGFAKFDVKKSGEKVIVEDSVKDVRPFTTCAIVKNLKLDEEKLKEIIDIQEKLHVTYGRNRKKVAIGIYPMEKIKMPIKFLARPAEDILFQPLESDKEMHGNQILEHHPKGKEYAHLLEDMDMYPLFVDANDKVLSMPPVINSHDVGKIDMSTTEVFIECSGFDFEALEKSLNMIVTALADMGAELYSMELEYGNETKVTPNLAPTEMDVDINYINTWLGLDLNEEELKDCFERMGYGYQNKKAQIPSYRADILHPSDLAEDVAIAYGYDNFKPIIPKVATIAQEDPFAIFKNKISRLLVGLGMMETSIYHLTNAENQNKKMNTDFKLIELANSISEDYSVLQAWIAPSVLQIISENKHNEYPQKIFTISRVFKKNPETDTGVQEDDRLAVAIAAEDADYTAIRQVIDYILKSIAVPYTIKEGSHDAYIEGRVAEISVSGKKLGYVGEIHPQVLENWELETAVGVLEINLSALFEIMNKKEN